MKKILIAFDGINFSEGAFEFARKMNKFSPILLSGIFIPQVVYDNLWSYASVEIERPFYIPLVEGFEEKQIKKNIERFEKMCIDNKIRYSVHKDFFDLALPELKKETRYADLVLIGSESFFENIATTSSNEYLMDALHAAECPVVVMPEKYNFPKSNILAYDGSESSVYAIKQFAYLFPDLANNKTLLVYTDEKRSEEIPEMKNIEELTERHFPDLTILKLNINPKKFFDKWLSEKESAILVSGSFGRSSFSRMLKKSFVIDVIKDHKLPVFITHK